MAIKKPQPDPAAILLKPATAPMSPAPIAAPEVQPATPDLNSALFNPAPVQPAQPKLADAPIPARPTGTMDNMGGWRKAGLLASIFAGEAAKPGSMQPILGQMRQQQEAQRQYDANKPVIQQQANDERAQRELTRESTLSTIQQRQRQFQMEQANKKATLLSQLQTELQSGKVPAEQLKYKYGRLASVQGITLAPEEIDQELQQVKPVGSAFEVVKGEGGRPEGLKDRAGKVYTPDAIPGDPEAQAMWTAAQKGHAQARTEKKEDQAAAMDAAVARAVAFNENKYVPVVDPKNPGNILYQKVGEAARAGAASPQSATAMAAKATARDAAIGDIAKSNRAFDTAEQHLQTLEKAGKALDNGDIQAINGIANKFGLATGKEAPATYAAIQQVIAGEINKAISGAGSVGEGEMNVVRNLTNPNLSPQQRAGVVAGIRELMRGKKAALAQQVKNGMSGGVVNIVGGDNGGNVRKYNPASGRLE